MSAILNVCGYRFVELSDAALLRESMHSRARELELRGTVILASEGINLALSGPHGALQRFIAEMRTDARLADIELKFSASDTVPFGRLLFKLKPEIIRMNQPVVQPQKQRAPMVDAATLARWLDAGHDDEGRALVLLDTRNGFEVDQGRFANAIDWRLERFSDFPQALQERRAELQGKTVVSYCTGGIRCEKAALWMQRCGVDNVRQLDGGILKYFEQQGPAHFEGTCFVFDERETLDGTLSPVPAM